MRRRRVPYSKLKPSVSLRDVDEMVLDFMRGPFLEALLYRYDVDIINQQLNGPELTLGTIKLGDGIPFNYDGVSTPHSTIFVMNLRGCGVCDAAWPGGKPSGLSRRAVADPDAPEAEILEAPWPSP